MSKLVFLPTDILLYFFNSYFSLQELFHLRGLCCRVQFLIESRHCIGKRQSLKLFWSFLAVQQYTDCLYYWKLEENEALALKSGPFDDDLILCGPKFTRSTADWLARLFPRLTHLLIMFHTSRLSPPPTGHYPVLPYLITRWPCSLLSLTLFGIFFISFQQKKQFVDELCYEISEKLPSLKHLDLCAEFMFTIPNPNGTTRANRFVYIPIALSDRFVRQLERLNQLIMRPLDAPEQLLRKLMPINDDHQDDVNAHHSSTKLHITYGHGSNMFEELVQISSFGQSAAILRSTLASSVTHLTFLASFDRWEHRPTLDRLVSLFTGLRSLALEQLNLQKVKQPSRITLVEILLKLTNLHQLTELKLRNFQLSPLQDIQLNQPRLRMLKITHLTIQDDGFEQIDSLGCEVFFTAIRFIFPVVRSYNLKLFVPLSEPIDDQVHLAQFGALTRFVIDVYPAQTSVIPHLLGGKHRRRFESQLLQAEPVDQIGPGHAGRELWIRKQQATTIGLDNRDDEKKKTFTWAKSTLVYDALRLKQVGVQQWGSSSVGQ